MEDSTILKSKIHDELLTVADIMDILKVGKNSVYLLQNSGMLPFLKLGDRKVRRKTLEQCMAKWECLDGDIITIAREQMDIKTAL